MTTPMFNIIVKRPDYEPVTVLRPSGSEQDVCDQVTELARKALLSRKMDPYSIHGLGAEIMLHFLIEGAE